MSRAQRVIYHTTDISDAVGSYTADNVTVAYTLGQYIYIGCEVPFNSLWWDMSTVNTTAANASIDIWFANAWNAAVDIIDGTKTATGRSLGQDGRISFSTNLLKGWDPEQDSADVTGLESTAIYNMYWTRWSWSATLLSSTALSYIGQKFSTDADLFLEYPDLNNTDLMAAFSVGKTNWLEQAYRAGDVIVRDLKERQVIKNRGQMLDWEIWMLPSVHKTAEIIYAGMGQTYENLRIGAGKKYATAMNQGYMRIDKNMSGNLDTTEQRTHIGYLKR